jgi:hypothetical protein
VVIANASSVSWTFEPLPLAAVAVVGAAYARRAVTLGRRGTPVPA